MSEKTPTPMPPRLSELRQWLYDELAALNIKWSEFCLLYGKDQERVDVLNRVAPAFFHEHQRMAWQDVFIHLCRITDPPEMGPPQRRHENLTIKRIPREIPDPTLRAEVEALLDNAERKTGLIRDWRNRRLAHHELPTSPQAAKPLAPATRQEVDEALAAIQSVMNRIETHYLEVATSYDRSIEPLGGVGKLINWIRGRQ